MEKRRQLQIEKAASRLRKELKLSGLKKFDISAVLGAHEIEIEARNLKSDISGFSVIEGSRRIIAFNKSQSEVRQRFTIAHELGHLTLHSEQSLNVATKQFYRNDLSSQGIDQKEVEANYFAACFLMPTKLIERCLKENDYFDAIDEDNIEELALTFKVSTAAMTIRLSGLGYI